MKGQSEVMIFVLLFAIGLMIFIIAIFWGWGIFQQNMDIGKVAAAENFMRKLNDEISNLIKYGGSTSLDYNLDGTIELISDDTIEFKTTVNLELPTYWINLTPTDMSSFENKYVEGLPSIREMLDGNLFKIRLTYPPREYYSEGLKIGELKVELFTEGPRVAMPDVIKIEKNSTHSYNDFVVTKIKINFI